MADDARLMQEIVGVPLWLVAAPPLVAAIAIVAWWGAPQVRRNVGYRALLITSVSVTAVEVMLGALFFFVLVLFSRSGGMENF
jgi:hypothetical protein